MNSMNCGFFAVALALLPIVAVAQSDAPSPGASPTASAAAARPPAHANKHQAPYAQLAYDLETPDLVDSEGPKDKSLLKLRYVASGESETAWSKMTSISIAKVKPEDTVTATRSIIAKFKENLEGNKRAKIATFDQNLLSPGTVYFEFHSADGVAEQGVAYSPASGFVSVVQIAYKHGYLHAAVDRGILKSLLTPH